jgi:inner membrane protein
MDTFTHILAGGVIAKAINDEKVGNWGTLAGAAVGLFPDTDIVLGFLNREFSIQYHRGFTHSLLLAPFYALLFSWLLTKISRCPHFWIFYKICLPVLVCHALLDLFTSYGTMIFAPFWNHRYALDLLFIIDFIFSGLIAVPFFLAIFWKKKAHWLCRGSLVGLTIYLLFCGVQHQRAIGLAKAFAQSLNREVIQVASMPQPLSPLRWGNYIETRERVYQGFVDLGMKGSPPPSNPARETDSDGSEFFGRFRRWKLMEGLYDPASNVRYLAYEKNEESPWVKRALSTEGAKFYYWFARFPVAKEVASHDGTHRVEFTDVRFFLPGIRMPFTYYIELDETGRVRSQGFVRDGKRSSI